MSWNVPVTYTYMVCDGSGKNQTTQFQTCKKQTFHHYSMHKLFNIIFRPILYKQQYIVSGYVLLWQYANI